MGITPQDQDLLDKIRSLETRLANLERRSGLQAASISSGGLTVQDGGDITVLDGGTVDVHGGHLIARNTAGNGYLHAGPVSGGTFATILYRQDTTPALIVKENFTLWDITPAAILYDDPVSGGFARPFMQSGVGASMAVPTDTTTSGTFQGLQKIFHRKLHPRMLAGLLINLTAGTGEVRLRDTGSGAVIGGPIPISAGFGYGFYGPYALDAAFHSFYTIDVEARVVTGGGTIGVRVLLVEGQQ